MCAEHNVFLTFWTFAKVFKKYSHVFDVTEVTLILPTSFVVLKMQITYNWQLLINLIVYSYQLSDFPSDHLSNDFSRRYFISYVATGPSQLVKCQWKVLCVKKWKHLNVFRLGSVTISEFFTDSDSVKSSRKLIQGEEIVWIQDCSLLDFCWIWIICFPE